MRLLSPVLILGYVVFPACGFRDEDTALSSRTSDVFVAATPIAIEKEGTDAKKNEGADVVDETAAEKSSHPTPASEVPKPRSVQKQGTRTVHTYYNVRLGELMITEGELPKQAAYSSGPRWSTGSLRVAQLPVWSYAVVEGGEAYVGSPYARDAPLEKWRIVIRLPKGREVTGRLFLSNSNGKGMAAIRFAVPIEQADANGRQDFYRGKCEYYAGLASMGVPGAAWFQHQARQAVKEGKLSPHLAQVLPQQSPLVQQRPIDLAGTYALFNGGRAISENLQLDLLLAETRVASSEFYFEWVPIDSIPGVTIREMDWTPLIEGLRPDKDPLAALIPADQHMLLLPNVEAATTTGDLMSEMGTIFLRLAEPRAENFGLVARYERQLGLSIGDVAQIAESVPIHSLALTGSDLYFVQGTDLAILLETPDTEQMASLIREHIKSSTAEVRHKRWTARSIGGLAYRGVRTADRRLCTYVAKLPGAVVVTNSVYQLSRLARVQQGKLPPVASLPEYTFFRARYVRGNQEETAFGMLSDATIRRLCGPRWRIGASRRIRDGAVLMQHHAEYLDELVGGYVSRRSISPDLRLSMHGSLGVVPSGVISPTSGNVGFMTPIGELPLERVTPQEQRAYEQWRGRYERNWARAFDPIALRLTVSEVRLAADLTVMPLVVATRYRSLVSFTEGVELAPLADDVHDALAHVLLGFNSPLQFRQSRAPSADTPVVGPSLAVYADRDPFWEKLAGVPTDEQKAYLEQQGWPFPVGVRARFRSEKELTNIVDYLRTAAIEYLTPKKTQWDDFTYNGDPYTKVSLNERGLEEAARWSEIDLSHAALYYAASGDVLSISPNQDVLKRALDRHRHREADGGEPPIPSGKPWPGKSARAQISAEFVDYVGRLGRDRYQAMMQARSWANLPILNEWRCRYPEEDPITLHQRFWQARLICPGGGEYVWNDRWQTFESTIYGNPGEPKTGPNVPPALSGFAGGNFGLTFENQGLRAHVSLERAKPGSLTPVVLETVPAETPQSQSEPRPSTERETDHDGN